MSGLGRNLLVLSRIVRHGIFDQHGQTERHDNEKDAYNESSFELGFELGVIVLFHQNFLTFSRFEFTVTDTGPLPIRSADGGQLPVRAGVEESSSSDGTPMESMNFQNSSSLTNPRSSNFCSTSSRLLEEE